MLHPRQIILFLLIVLTPLGLAAWLGLKVARDEQATGQHQFQALLQGRLRDVDSIIARTIHDVERHLVDKVLSREPGHGAAPQDQSGMAAEQIEFLRALRRKEPLVREIFMLDTQGRLLFPPEDASASAEELAFRARTAAIWRGDAVLYGVPAPESAALAQGRGLPDEGAVESPVPGHSRIPEPPIQGVEDAQGANLPGAPPDARPPRGDSILALARTQPHGWITWYWEEGLHLLFWRRMDTGRVMGVEIERVALLSRIVGKLPASGIDEGRVVLTDASGHALHQWGPYEPATGEEPLASTPVSEPLHTWRIQHFVSPAQKQAFFANTLRMNLLVGFLAVALSLMAMALWFYRDYARRMRDAAERVSFVTRVSHELKTPLTNIRLYAELIDNELLDEDDRARRRLSVIIAESQRLTRLINNILTFSKQHRAKLDLHKTAIQVNEVVESVLAQFAPALEAKGIKTSFTAGAGEPVQADSDAIGQIVANLVSNVEKYAASGAFLHITTLDDESQTVVRVADRGPGIAPPHQEKIFRPFYRVSDKLADGVTGTGIGLAIARELARMSGGDLVLVPADQGACFELRLPRRKEQGHEGARS